MGNTIYNQTKIYSVNHNIALYFIKPLNPRSWIQGFFVARWHPLVEPTIPNQQYDKGTSNVPQHVLKIALMLEAWLLSLTE